METSREISTGRRRRLQVILTVLLVATAVTGWLGVARIARRLGTLQAQVEDLKKGQDRTLDELRALRAQLPVPAPPNEVMARPEAGPKIASMNVHGEPFKGQATAGFAIIEYSDFECDYCARYATQVFPLIAEHYIKTGKIRYFFRDFPESTHPGASLKARAARCAGEQGAFWELHDRLFATSIPSTPEALAAEAAALKLDGPRFAACLSEGRYGDNIQRSAAGAGRAGFQGTPTFVIGTVTDDGDIVRVQQVLVGVESFDTLRKQLDEILALKP
jgi:hypothetical protein